MILRCGSHDGLNDKCWKCRNFNKHDREQKQSSSERQNVLLYLDMFHYDLSSKSVVDGSAFLLSRVTGKKYQLRTGIDFIDPYHVDIFIITDGCRFDCLLHFK